jgi:RNA polymerase sigma-70 factor, ECF subfamily
MSVITASRPRRMTNYPGPIPLLRSSCDERRGFGSPDYPEWASGTDHEGTPRIGTSSGSTEFPESHTWCDPFAEIVGPRLARLQRLARKILRSDDLADDAVQEALLSLWREERPPPNLDGWLVRAVVNRSLHLNRTRRRRRYHEERACLGRSEQDPAGDVSRPLEVEEVARAIEAALSGLPDHLRTVFVLREVEQMDYKSIAEALQVPVGTVRSRLNRSRIALQQVLKRGAWADRAETR